MRRSTLFRLSLLLLLAVSACKARDFARSVKPLDTSTNLASTHFDPAQSAGLFVGVRKFLLDPSLTDVRYAADDAVDLAYAFSMGPGEKLLLPSRVVIALSSDPYKQESEERLRALKAAGATVTHDVSNDNLVRLLRQQTALTGRDGMMIASFATHGFNTDGIPYLLSGSSRFSQITTTLSAMEVTDIVATAPARRSLIFFDMCRQRVRADIRGYVAQPSARLFDKIARVEGQVVFYAAAAGGYAHDDPKRGNGAFTAAVIDALQCAPGDSRWITVDKLATRVEKQVLAFLQKHDPSIRTATQISADGMTRSMPLVQCRPPLSVPGQLATVAHHGSTLEAFGITGQSLWRRTLSGTIRKADVEQLFQEKTNQAVVLSDGDDGASVVSIYDNAGNLHASVTHDGWLQFMAIAKPTWRHNPRIVIAGTRRNLATVSLIEPKNTGGAKPKWFGTLHDPDERITGLTIGEDHRKATIVVSTSSGRKIRLDFDGHLIDDRAPMQFSLISLD